MRYDRCAYRRWGLEFTNDLKHLCSAVSGLDTGGLSPYGARAFGTVVMAAGIFKGLIIYG